jgi:hypothetical protein
LPPPTGGRKTGKIEMVEPDKEHKYCPECGAEYDPQYEKCADCHIELVNAQTFAEIRRRQNELAAASKRSAAETGRKRYENTRPGVSVVFLSYERSDAELVHDLLVHAGIEAVLEEIDLFNFGIAFFHRKGFQVVVPSEKKDESIFRLEQDGIIRSPACEGGRAPDEEIAERFRKTVEQGISALPELAQFLYEELPVRRQAIFAILSAGEEGEELLARKVVEICSNPNPLEERELEIVKDIGETIGQHGETCALVDAISDALAEPDPIIRKNLVTALGYTDMDEALPCLVSCLDDPDQEIRHEALDALFFRTGEDFGFDPDAPEKDRQEALKKWRKWLKENYPHV